jgi:glycosyltransferase involved in cell wall biosynthesis
LIQLLDFLKVFNQILLLHIHVLIKLDFSIKILQMKAPSDSKTKSLVTVGMMGQFSRSKGHLEFLQMAKYISDKDKNYIFKVLGVKKLNESKYYKFIRFVFNKKKLDEQVHAFIERNKLHDYIKLIPWKSDVNNEVLAIDIMVRPSLSMDPWGRDVIESMALSKPIVAYGSSNFFIKNNKTGILVGRLDYRDLADAVMSLGSNKDNLKRMGAKGRVIIENMCNIDQYGKNLYDVYKSLLTK